MSILALTSNTLIGTAAAGNIEYDGQFFATDSAASRAQLQRIVRATAVTSTSGTSVDFTGIPAWAERITVMLSGVSLSGTDNILIKLGTSGGVVSSGYNSTCGNIATSTASLATSTAGFVSFFGTAAFTQIGSVTITNITGNVWVASGVIRNSTSNINYLAGDISLGGTLDRVQIATNGSNTFDAGTINILYE